MFVVGARSLLFLCPTVKDEKQLPHQSHVRSADLTLTYQAPLTRQLYLCHFNDADGEQKTLQGQASSSHKGDWDFMRLCAISLVSESFKKKSVSSSSCVFIQRVAVLEMNLLLDYWNKKLIKPRVSYWLGFSLRQSSAERRESKGFIFSFFLPDGLCEGMKCVWYLNCGCRRC